MNLRLIGGGVLMLATLFACWRWDVASTERDAAQREARQANDRIAEQAQSLSVRDSVIEQQQQQAARLVEIDRGIQSLRQTVDKQGAGHRAAIEELKRNDADVRDYLRGSVPDALGVHYQRPGTTDPAAYRRDGGGMPTNAVPSASARAD